MYVLICVLGAVMIGLFPILFDFACDVLFPAGEAQIVGCMNTLGNVLGTIIVILILFRSLFVSMD